MVAAVLFPNTQPPFAPPAATQFEAPPYSDDFEHRWAGLRAHNRWLADFVSEAPTRRAGIAQIFLGDVEGSVAEIEWAAEQGSARRHPRSRGAARLAVRAAVLGRPTSRSGLRPMPTT